MTREKAVALYLKYDKYAARIVKRLMMWDSKITLEENARKMKTKASQIFYLKKKMKLKCRIIGQGNYQKEGIWK